MKVFPPRHLNRMEYYLVDESQATPQVTLLMSKSLG